MKSFHFTFLHLYINSRLHQKYPILKWELPLMALMIPSIYVLTNPFYENSILFWLAGLFQVAYFLVISYRLYGISQTPDVRVYFIGGPSFKGRQSTSTFVSFAKLCLECGKYGLGRIMVTYGLPKLFLGVGYRSAVANTLGYCVTGLESENDFVYSYAVELVQKDPSLKSLIVEADGYTINEEKLKEAFLKKKGWYPLSDFKSK